MDHPVISPKKLIEVSLPLDAINHASAKEKSNPFLKGHPRGLQQWWARRPLPAARAVIFCQLVNDPSWKWELDNQGQIPSSQLKANWAKNRKRLFKIVEDLVLWENMNNEDVLRKAREEIRKSWRETCEANRDHPCANEIFDPNEMPALLDPFAGGGAIPLEAQRLGLPVYASDLNPVAVLINKAMIEIPPRFADIAPVNAESRTDRQLISRSWRGSQGLAEDFRFYSNWIQAKAEERIGELYPSYCVTSEHVKQRPDLEAYANKELTVVAWIWARTVKSPNPAFSHVYVPLASTFVLSNKKGKEAYVEPVIRGDEYSFTVRVGPPTSEAKCGTTAGKRKAFRCLLSGSPMDYEYIRGEAKQGRMGFKLMAVVAEGHRGKLFLTPTEEMEGVADRAVPEWKPDCEMPKKHRNFQPPVYGMYNLGDLFTNRQLVALNTFCELVEECRQLVHLDACEAGMPSEGNGLEAGGNGALAYADAIALFASLSIDKLADYNNTVCSWNPTNQNVGHLFSKQAIPMVWDFPESSPLQGGLSFASVSESIAKSIDPLPASSRGIACQRDAATFVSFDQPVVVSTDPPYYDNICYAELSDFFYVWLRRSLRHVFPDLFATVAVPKAEELIAAANRHGSKEAAEQFFLAGMTNAFRVLIRQSHPSFPLTIYYAFKQSETDSEEGTTSTGWETFLTAVLQSGFALTGTWPMRTEREARSLAMDTNALASSIVLVCRKRSDDASAISRREFIRELNVVLPEAIDEMTRGSGEDRSPVAPVDLSQAVIGPGMAVFSKYAAVLEADGTPMTVRTALQLINRFLAEDDFDADTQFCLHWFEQYGWETGKFGEADTLARAKGTSVDGVKQAGVLHAAGGNVRLLKWAEYSSDWDPQSDQRLPIWEVLHQLIRVFITDGETGAAAVFAAVQSKAEAARQLAYRLYTLCERKNWAEDARAYNEVVTSWSGIESTAAKEPAATQRTLFDN